MRDQPVGPDSPVGRLDEPRIHRSSLRVSTPEGEEIGQELGRWLEESLHQSSGPPTVASRRPRQRTPLQ